MHLTYKGACWSLKQPTNELQLKVQVKSGIYAVAKWTIRNSAKYVGINKFIDWVWSCVLKHWLWTHCIFHALELLIFHNWSSARWGDTKLSGSLNWAVLNNQEKWDEHTPPIFPLGHCAVMDRWKSNKSNSYLSEPQSGFPQKGNNGISFGTHLFGTPKKGKLQQIIWAKSVMPPMHTFPLFQFNLVSSLCCFQQRRRRERGKGWN